MENRKTGLKNLSFAFMENNLADLEKLRDLIEEKTGLFYRDWNFEVLDERVKARIEESGYASIAEYHDRLAGDPSADRYGDQYGEEWLHLITALTIIKSPFARHAAHVRALTEVIIPRWIESRGGPQLRIWSAGCSTGQEPLSIAMALTESGWADKLEIEINASDANLNALETAKRGIYSEEHVRYLQPDWREKYFDAVDDNSRRAKPEIHSRIDWSITNLKNEREIEKFASSDIIFCRNVFIYFSDKTITQTLNAFAKFMPAGGFLFSDTGDHFNSLVSETGVFENQKIGHVSVWEKLK